MENYTTTNFLIEIILIVVIFLLMFDSAQKIGKEQLIKNFEEKTGVIIKYEN